MKPLQDLTLQEYEKLKASGMFWVYYPEATGNCNKDLQAICVGDALVFKRFSSPGSYTNQSKYVKSYFYDIIDEEAEYEFN